MYEKGNNSDKLFYENILKAEYISDAAGGTGGAYSIEGVSNSLFDGYSLNYDNSLLKKLSYKVPTQMVNFILKNTSNQKLGSIFDLGCGTGLLGQKIKKYCSRIEGIDLSKYMLEEAKKKQIYCKLYHSDIVDHLKENELDFNFYIATDVFMYIGDLSEIFRLIKLRNKRSGFLAFSTEHDEQENYLLQKSGRFSHSKSYIMSLCNNFDYTLDHFEKVKIRKEKDQFLTGGLYLIGF